MNYLFKDETLLSELMFQLAIPKLGDTIRTEFRMFINVSILKSSIPNFTKINCLVILLQECKLNIIFISNAI